MALKSGGPRARAPCPPAVSAGSSSRPHGKEIATHVKKNLAGHAFPREIEFRDKLPKTRSGKIMRRVLKAWDQGLPVGDISTLED